MHWWLFIGPLSRAISTINLISTNDFIWVHKKVFKTTNRKSVTLTRLITHHRWAALGQSHISQHNRKCNDHKVQEWHIKGIDWYILRVAAIFLVLRDVKQRKKICVYINFRNMGDYAYSSNRKKNNKEWTWDRDANRIEHLAIRLHLCVCLITSFVRSFVHFCILFSCGRVFLHNFLSFSKYTYVCT